MDYKGLARQLDSMRLRAVFWAKKLGDLDSRAEVFWTHAEECADFINELYDRELDYVDG